MEAIAAKAENQLERVALVALGWILMLAGILGLFLPIVPGAFLIVAGALMLSPRNVWLQRAEKCRARFPVLDRVFRRVFAWRDSGRRRFGHNAGNCGSTSAVGESRTARGECHLRKTKDATRIATKYRRGRNAMQDAQSADSR
jgi:hypothetical protein